MLAYTDPRSVTVDLYESSAQLLVNSLVRDRQTVKKVCELRPDKTALGMHQPAYSARGNLFKPGRKRRHARTVFAKVIKPEG